MEKAAPKADAAPKAKAAPKAEAAPKADAAPTANAKPKARDTAHSLGRIRKNPSVCCGNCGSQCDIAKARLKSKRSATWV